MMAVEVFMGASVDKLKKCYICKKEMTLENYYLSKNGNYMNILSLKVAQ